MSISFCCVLLALELVLKARTLYHPWDEPKTPVHFEDTSNISNMVERLKVSGSNSRHLVFSRLLHLMQHTDLPFDFDGICNCFSYNHSLPRQISTTSCVQRHTIIDLVVCSKASNGEFQQSSVL